AGFPPARNGRCWRRRYLVPVSTTEGTQMAKAPNSLSLTRSSPEWVAYFEQNAARQRPIPWESGAGVTDAELAAIASSLRGWQLGETSDGAHLLAAARHYASTTGDPDFVNAVQLFIAEEQR